MIFRLKSARNENDYKAALKGLHSNMYKKKAIEFIVLNLFI